MRPRELAIPTPAGTLHGTLLVPETARFATLLVPGSGPTDRDGNGPGLHSDCLRKLAEALAAADIASLRYDKRGVGASAAALASEEDLSFELAVADARAALSALRAEAPDVPTILIGHSEGALIASLAAPGSAAAGLVTLAGPGRPAPEIVAEQLAAAALPPMLSAESETLLAELAAGRPVTQVSLELAPLFRPGMQPYVIGWFAHDPSAALADAGLPALVVQGTHDLQVAVADGERLAAASPRARLVLIEGLNHVLADAPAERAGNLETYARPGSPLSAGLVPAIIGFAESLS